MNARTRTARAILRARTRTQRAASRISRRGVGTLAAHGIAAGLAPKAARSVAASLRKAVVKLGLAGTPGRTHAGRRMRDCVRFTPAQVAVAAGQYQPRLPLYRAARQHFLLAA
jgi:hypothetical protein